MKEFNFISHINTITKGEIYHAKMINDKTYIVTMLDSDGEWKMSKGQIEQKLKSQQFEKIQ